MKQGRSLKFAYLNLKEHPRGNFMLHRLIQHGWQPEAVIEEESSLAVKGRTSLLNELEKLLPLIPLPLSMRKISETYSVRYEIVENHNDPKTLSLLHEIQPDLIVLGDTRIIKPPLIALPPKGIINVHPGYLPIVRGNNPYVWALLHNLPQGASAHFIDEGIDTGPVIVRKKMSLENIHSYPLLLHQLNILCSDVLNTAIDLVQKGFTGKPQNSFEEIALAMPTFHAASPQDKMNAAAKLNKIYQLSPSPKSH